MNSAWECRLRIITDRLVQSPLFGRDITDRAERIQAAYDLAWDIFGAAGLAGDHSGETE